MDAQVYKNYMYAFRQQLISGSTYNLMVDVFDVTDKTMPKMVQEGVSLGLSAKKIFFPFNGRIRINSTPTPTMYVSEAAELSTGITKYSIHVIDLSNPQAIVQKAVIPEYLSRFTANNGRIFAASSVSGEKNIKVLDVKNPAKPTVLATIKTASEVKKITDMQVSGKRLYIAYPSSIDIYDITTISSPRKIASRKVAAVSSGLSSINSIQIQGQMIYADTLNSSGVGLIGQPRDSIVGLCASEALASSEISIRKGSFSDFQVLDNTAYSLNSEDNKLVLTNLSNYSKQINACNASSSVMEESTDMEE